MKEGSKYIVVVDDDPGMCSALNRLLVAAGMHVKVFQSGGELLASGVAAAAECLVLDINLPDMTGFELLERLSANGQPDFVIFITAYDQPGWQAQAVAKSAGYFPKPFSGHDLVAAIRQGRRERAGSSAS